MLTADDISSLSGSALAPISGGIEKSTVMNRRATAETSKPACHKDPRVGWNYHICMFNSLAEGQRGCQDGDCSSIQNTWERNLGAIMPPLQLWLISASWACASLRSPPDMKHVANWYLNFSPSETQSIHRRETSSLFIKRFCSISVFSKQS